jgi:uncharacterized membrane protein
MLLHQRTTLTTSQFLPGEELAKIEAVIPGGADRVLAIIERQSNHRMEQERRVVLSNVIGERIGQLVAAIVVLGGMYGGYHLIVAGKDAAGFVAALVPLGVVAGIFLTGRKKRDRELNEKDQPR